MIYLTATIRQCIILDGPVYEKDGSVLWNGLHNKLTHWGLNKMAVISPMTFSNAFYWEKYMYFACSNFTKVCFHGSSCHYIDVIMTAMASQITRLTIIYSTVYSGANQRKHQSSASLAFVRGIHRWPMNSPQKGPVTRKMFPFDDVSMSTHRIRPVMVGAWWGGAVTNVHNDFDGVNSLTLS